MGPTPPIMEVKSVSKMGFHYDSVTIGGRLSARFARCQANSDNREQQDTPEGRTNDNGKRTMTEDVSPIKKW